MLHNFGKNKKIIRPPLIYNKVNGWFKANVLILTLLMSIKFKCHPPRRGRYKIDTFSPEKI